MSIVLYHHPYSRAATVVWMLEEVGVPYELRHIDIMTGAQKAPDFLALNAMGKVPTLTDGDLVVTEVAAIGLYLADHYAYGRLAPKVETAERGTYLRWSLFAPSVIEPGAMAKSAGWSFKDGQAGWGNYDAMLKSMQSALSHGDYLLGDTFSMADAVFGGTLRYMLQFNMLEPLEQFKAYAARLGERPALKRADARHVELRESLGLNHG